MAIDTQEIAGEKVPAAAEQIVDTNSYAQDGDEFRMPEMPPEPAQEAVSPPDEQPVEDPQDRNFKSLRDEVDRIKAERESEKREYQAQLDMMRANLAQRQEPAPQAKKMFSEMSDSDVPNVAEIRKAWEQRESEYQAKIEELAVAQQHPDYAEVIEKFGVPLVKNNASIADGFRGASNKAAYLYEMGKMVQKQQQAQEPPPPPAKPSETARRIVENSRKPGNTAQAGGQSVLSKADYYASMSDQDFMKLASRHLESI